MMHRFDRALPNVTAQQTRRAASAGGGVIHASAPEGLDRCAQHHTVHCGAVAGKSVHGPMT